MAPSADSQGGLPSPRTAEGAAGLAAIREAPREALVALDFDGTLAPIVENPAEAWAHPRAAGALRDLSRQVGTVAILTGRPAAIAVTLAGLEVDESGRLIVLGHYGFERWDGGTGQMVSPAPPPGIAVARQRLPGLLTGAPAGTKIEDKGLALAVHVRRTGDPEKAMASLRPMLEQLASEAGLQLEPGRFVLELRPRGLDKGGALTALVAERGARAVLFAGDDLGDLAAFAAVDELRRQGVQGVTVWSASPEVPALAERADVVVNGPEGVVALLEALAGTG